MSFANWVLFVISFLLMLQKLLLVLLFYLALTIVIRFLPAYLSTSFTSSRKYRIMPHASFLKFPKGKVPPPFWPTFIGSQLGIELFIKFAPSLMPSSTTKLLFTLLLLYLLMSPLVIFVPVASVGFSLRSLGWRVVVNAPSLIVLLAFGTVFLSLLKILLLTLASNRT